MSQHVSLHGTYGYRSGYIHGLTARSSVQENVNSFLDVLRASGYGVDRSLDLARRRGPSLPLHWQEELLGISEGADVPLGELLAYNLYRDLVWPEECTVALAVGSASATGETVLLKNSDKVGGASLVGPNFFKNKEVNVVLHIEREDGLKLLGVCAAGTTGLKMGMNNRGMVAGCNIARTVELDEKKIDITKIRALDRTYLLRLGLEQASVADAAKAVAGELMVSPMATPGNLQFADARQAYMIEGSYDRLAVKKVVDEVDVRSNRFITLEYMDRKDDLSSICRYHRGLELLQSKKGRVTLNDLVQVSADHANGPGPNSICRHGTNFTEEISLAAMVMGVNSQDPERSRFGICLGKPCHAWRDPQGHLFGDMTCRREDFSEGFLNGETFKQFYREEPKLE